MALMLSRNTHAMCLTCLIVEPFTRRSRILRLLVVFAGGVYTRRTRSACFRFLRSMNRSRAST